VDRARSIAPVDRCARRAQIWAGRPWQRNGRPTDMSQLSVGPGRPAGRPRTRVAGRPTDAFCSPFWIRTPFLFWGRIQSGFPKFLGLSGYKYELEPSCIVSLEVPLWYSLVLIVESIKSLSPLPRGRRQITEPR